MAGVATASAPDAMVVIVLSDTAACLETLKSIVDVLDGRTVVNLTSGSPDDGRTVAAMMPAGAAYMDGAYCGPPAKARQGAGVLFLSSEAAAEVERLRSSLSMLGELCFTGTRIGASRALARPRLAATRECLAVRRLGTPPNHILLQLDSLLLHLQLLEMGRVLLHLPLGCISARPLRPLTIAQPRHLRRRLVPPQARDEGVGLAELGLCGIQLGLQPLRLAHTPELARVVELSPQIWG